MKIGLRIKKLRELKNLTQDFVAHEIGLSQPQYSKIENGEDITLSVLEKIATLFEMQLEDIIRFNEKMVFNLHNNKKASGVIINNMSSYERKIFESHIHSLKMEISHLKNVMNKILGKNNQIKKPTKKK